MYSGITPISIIANKQPSSNTQAVKYFSWYLKKKNDFRKFCFVVLMFISNLLLRNIHPYFQQSSFFRSQKNCPKKEQRLRKTSDSLFFVNRLKLFLSKQCNGISIFAPHRVSTRFYKKAAGRVTTYESRHTRPSLPPSFFVRR